jgi:hypothetical protein
MLNTIALQTLMRASQNLKAIYRFRMNTFLQQSPKILVFAESLGYEIETVKTTKDLLYSLKLRSQLENSYGDFRLSLPGFSLSDELDSKADHIVFRNKKTNLIVGGFRLLSSSFTTKFSSEKNFDLTELKTKSSGILELSRLFLLPEHRHKEIMSLTVQFLSHYCLNSASELIISEQTLSSRSSRNAALTYLYFSSVSKLSTDYRIFCRPDCEVPSFQHWINHFKNGLSQSEQREVHSLFSTVFAESLELGTMIGGRPSLDKLTNRIDFLTILHKDDLNRALWKKSRPYSESFLESSSF